MKNTKKIQKGKITCELKGSKGITLVALVVTIIILLILAGITIVQLQNNGLFGKSKLARIISREKTAEEKLQLKLHEVNLKNQKSLSLEDILNQFKEETEKDITVTEIMTESIGKLSESISDIPNGNISAITVIVKDYEEFSFTLGTECKITKICGIEYSKWQGETLNTKKIENEKSDITITVAPESQREDNVYKQKVEITVNSEIGWIDWSGKYAWTTSKVTEPAENEWKSITLEEGSNAKEKKAEVEKTTSEDGEYYLWVQVVTNRKKEVKSFGAYKLASVPTENEMICVLESKSDNDTKGKVQVGSTKTFGGWTLSYSKNEGADTAITQGTTTGIDVVQNDYIELKYSKEGFNDVIISLRVTELKIGYTLIYNANEGSGAPENQRQYDNPTFTISSTEPTRSGYVFEGWTINQSGSGKVYSKNETITLTGKITTIYAKWTSAMTATLTFNNNNELTEGTIATIVATSSVQITNATLKIGDQVVYTVNPDTTNLNVEVSIDNMSNLENLTFNETHQAQLTITSAGGLTKNQENNITVRNLTVGNATQLQALATAVNATTDPNTFEGKTIYQTKDINSSSISNWTPIGNNYAGTIKPFQGTFNGNDKSITNIKINNQEDMPVGLFGFTGENAIIKNVTISGNIAQNNSGRPSGGIVGRNGGIIDNCTNQATVTGLHTVGGIAGRNIKIISNCINSGNITGYAKVGGISGQQGMEDGSSSSTTCYILNCHNSGTILSTGYASDVEGNNLIGAYTGGIVGVNRTKIEQCINTGTVNATHSENGQQNGGITGVNLTAGTQVTKCTNTGSISGLGLVAGICGRNYGYVTYSSNSGTISSKKQAGGIVGNNRGRVQYVYNLGQVSTEGTTSAVGGICGNHNNGGSNIYTKNAYNNASILGNAASGGIVGNMNSTGTVSNVYHITTNNQIKGNASTTGNITGSGSASTSSSGAYSSSIYNYIGNAFKEIDGIPKLNITISIYNNYLF